MHMHQRAQRNFTPIDLVIVVAILGFLAAVAVPAYQDYAARSKMSEAISAVSACRSGITRAIQSGAVFTTIDDGGWGCEVAAGPGARYVAAILTLGTTDPATLGEVLITARGIAAGADGTISMKPCSNSAESFSLCTAPMMGDTINRWLCGPGRSGTAVAAKHLPGSCRIQ